MNGKTVVVTGLSGYFGQVLLPYLEQDTGIERVIGIDRRPLRTGTPGSKLRFHQLDIRDPGLEDVLRRADTLVHLAFVLMRLPGDREIDEVNIGGARKEQSPSLAQAASDSVVERKDLRGEGADD